MKDIYVYFGHVHIDLSDFPIIDEDDVPAHLLHYLPNCEPTQWNSKP